MSLSGLSGLSGLSALTGGGSPPPEPAPAGGADFQAGYDTALLFARLAVAARISTNRRVGAWLARRLFPALYNDPR